MIKWKEAPDDATHYCKSKISDDEWWIKKVGNQYTWLKIGHHQLWVHGLGGNWLTLIGRETLVTTARPVKTALQPKDLHGTYLYQQLREAIELAEVPANKRPVVLGQLVRRVLINIHNHHADGGVEKLAHKGKDLALSNAFLWEKFHDWELWVDIHMRNTVRGYDFNKFPSAKIIPKALPAMVVKKEEPKPQPKVGWW